MSEKVQMTDTLIQRMEEKKAAMIFSPNFSLLYNILVDFKVFYIKMLDTL